jgi:LPS export ABC transporter protein LptC
MMRTLFVGLGLIGFGLLAGCQQTSTTPSEVTSAELPAEAVVCGVNHIMTRNGIRSSVLTADSAFNMNYGQTLHLMGVRLSFFTDTGAEAGNLTSRTGEYDVALGRFNAVGDAVLLTTGPRGNRRLETEVLHYDLKTDDLWTDTPFTLTEGGRVTRGSSFRSDGKFQNWTVRNAETEGGLPSEGTGFSF